LSEIFNDRYPKIVMINTANLFFSSVIVLCDSLYVCWVPVSDAECLCLLSNSIYLPGARRNWN